MRMYVFTIYDSYVTVATGSYEGSARKKAASAFRKHMAERKFPKEVIEQGITSMKLQGVCEWNGGLVLNQFLGNYVAISKEYKPCSYREKLGIKREED